MTADPTFSDSILITHDKMKSVKIATQQLETVNSCLGTKQRGLSRVIIEAIGTKLAADETDLLWYLQSTLFWHQRPISVPKSPSRSNITASDTDFMP